MVTDLKTEDGAHAIVAAAEYSALKAVPRHGEWGERPADGADPALSESIQPSVSISQIIN